MGLSHRPYVGSWRLGNQRLVQMTPDTLVYINGDLSLPGCPKCNGKIDVQRFITEVSVDAGTDAAGSSASLTLSLPVHHNESFVRDAQFILHPGLEIQIYKRGYFPVKGLYSNLDQPQNLAGFMTSGATLPGLSGPKGGTLDETGLDPGEIDPDKVPSDVLDSMSKMGMNTELMGAAQQQAFLAAGNMVVVEKYWQQELGDSAHVVVTSHYRPGESNHGTGGAVDYQVKYVDANGQTKTVPFKDVWAGTKTLEAAGKITPGGNGLYINPKTGVSSSSPHHDNGDPREWMRLDTNGDNKMDMTTESAKLAADKGLSTGALGWLGANGYEDTAQFYSGGGQSDGGHPDVGDTVPNVQQVLGQAPYATPGMMPLVSAGVSEAQAQQALTGEAGAVPQFSPSVLQELGLQGQDIEEVLAYPYYHVFHGVVKNVNHSYSAGVQTVTLQCVSLLHFWQYHRVSTNASYLGAKPLNNKLQMSIVGHNFTGMHPYEIIYKMYHDVAGSAAGVAYALSQKTNQTARSPVTGESMFSVNLRYWEQRFKTRMAKLRMHGVSGELFNAAQAAWLGQTSSHALTGLMRGRFGFKEGGTNQIFQQATALGLFNQKRMDALVEWRAGTNDKNPKMDIVMTELEAFVMNLGNIGVNMFESTYESKQDIVERVCEITGFEFYQDVDGDFVFKPPMYNLDTSSSRVYRIEDIDIISINFTEDEPQYTYITGKGNQINGLLGHGLENEWGVQGQYIDYRLVAQFGWRPADFETTYLSDKKAVFFAAVNRLDIMNAPTKGASVTIPERPELRPGYPVYIPYVDCFYYCNSFAHSFSVGGQCTTSLQLIAKRAKFYAPGDPSKVGIEAIDQSLTDLPQRPLEVLDQGGRPRLAGFPNVVMALDPFQINPLFLVTGMETDLLDSEETLQGLLKMAVQLGILNTVDPSNPGPLYTMAMDETKDVTFYFDSSGGPAPQGTLDLRVTVAQYKKEFQNIEAAQKSIQAQMIKLDNKILNLEKQRGTVDLESKKGPAKEASLQKQIKELEKAKGKLNAQMTAKNQAFEADLGAGTKSSISFLQQILNQMGEAYIRVGGGPPDATYNLLNLLSDKKAVMTNGSLPGTYRYYSASHPDRQQQGQMQPDFRLKESADDESVTLGNPLLKSNWKGQTVIGFLPEAQKSIPPGGKEPEAQIGTFEPEWGINVLTSNPEFPTGEILPTSEIRTLMFASHPVLTKSPKTSTRRATQTDDWTTGMQKALRTSALAGGIQALWQTGSISDVFQIWYTTYILTVSAAVEAGRAALETALRDSVPLIQIPPFPTSVAFRGSSLNTSVVWGNGDYRFADTPDGEAEAFPGSAKITLEQFWKQMAEVVADAMYGETLEARMEWFRGLMATGMERKDAALAYSAFNASLGGGSGSSEKPKGKQKNRTKEKQKTTITSPVFPVSDAKGYEVIGSFRYGRDINIDADGVLDVLHRQDPLQLLDKHTVDQILRALVKGEPITVKRLKGQDPKTKKPIYESVTVAGSAAATALEAEVLQQLKRQLTDRQILDLGLAQQTGDPNVLQMNLANWFSEKGREGIQKVPINNAAHSLADLSIQTGQSACMCKAAEASVLLDIAGQQNFVQFLSPGVNVPQGFGEGTQDRVTQWMVATTAQAAVGWKQTQDALRGAVPDQIPHSIVTAVQNLDEQFQQASSKVGALKKQQNAAIQLADDKEAVALKAFKAED